MNSNTLSKAERLCSKISIGKMFEGGSSRSFSIFPLRVVYMPLSEGAAPASILVSVSKKRFKRAVKRNRIKRQIREAFRKNKHELYSLLTECEAHFAIAFIYLSEEIIPTEEIEKKVKTALTLIKEKLS